MKTVNYEMKFSVADVAKIFYTANSDLIKTWAHEFSSYLSSNANPLKGRPRQFQIEDVRVMAYIWINWENDPDIQSIKTGLNSSNHYDNHLINDILIEITPIFIEPPENIDETWTHGVVFCGHTQFADTYYLADSFKKAGDRIIDMVIDTEEAWELICPVLYNYRHSLELHMKAVLGKYKNSHNLIYLFDKFKTALKEKFNFTNTPEWFENIILAFNDFDPNGTTFRYGGEIKKDEVYIDLIQLKTLMKWVAQTFKNIRTIEGIPVK